MYTAYYYTKENNDTTETVEYLAKKYCLKLDRITDLRQMILRGSDLTKYSLIVDTTNVSISDDLIDYMINCGGNSKLMGIILIGDKDYTCKVADNLHVYVVHIGEGFGAELVDKSYRLKDNDAVKMLTDSLSEKVDDILLSAKITPKYLGYGFLKDAIIYCLAGNGSVEKLSNVVYPYIAGKNGTKASSVERNIRIAIEVAWRGTNTSFGFEEKPSNKAFIAYVVNDIKRLANK